MSKAAGLSSTRIPLWAVEGSRSCPQSWCWNLACWLAFAPLFHNGNQFACLSLEILHQCHGKTASCPTISTHRQQLCLLYQCFYSIQINQNAYRSIAIMSIMSMQVLSHRSAAVFSCNTYPFVNLPSWRYNPPPPHAAIPCCKDRITILLHGQGLLAITVLLSCPLIYCYITE